MKIELQVERLYLYIAVNSCYPMILLHIYITVSTLFLSTPIYLPLHYFYIFEGPCSYMFSAVNSCYYMVLLHIYVSVSISLLSLYIYIYIYIRIYIYFIQTFWTKNVLSMYVCLYTYVYIHNIYIYSYRSIHTMVFAAGTNTNARKKLRHKRTKKNAWPTLIVTCFILYARC